jgi:hypothetical protein
MIKKTIRKFINWAFDEDRDVDEKMSSGRLRRRNMVTESTDYLRSQGMSFTLYAAEGGTVIETSFYDSKADRNDHRLYLIPQGDDFNNTLGQIVSMERMKSWH